MKFVNLSRMWPLLERAAMRWLRRRVARVAEDRTIEMARRDCLIIVAHPDDEVLGCGGLMMRKRAAEVPVHVAVVTDGGMTSAADGTGARRGDILALRERETPVACSVLGITESAIRFLSVPGGALAAQDKALELRIAAFVQELSPSEIFVCALGDGPRDHVALARTVHDLGAAGRLRAAAVWEYPVWFWDFRSWCQAGASNKVGFVAWLRKIGRAAQHLNVVAVKLDGLGQRKREALACHRSQIGAFEEKPDWSGLSASFLEFFLGVAPAQGGALQR